MPDRHPTGQEQNNVSTGVSEKQAREVAEGHAAAGGDLDVVAHIGDPARSPADRKVVSDRAAARRVARQDGELAAGQAGPAKLMADHSHEPTSKKVLVAVGGQGIDAETVRLACRMTDTHGGKLYGVHIIEVNRSLPLGAVLEEVVEGTALTVVETPSLAVGEMIPMAGPVILAGSMPDPIGAPPRIMAFSG